MMVLYPWPESIRVYQAVVVLFVAVSPIALPGVRTFIVLYRIAIVYQIIETIIEKTESFFGSIRKNNYRTIYRMFRYDIQH